MRKPDWRVWLEDEKECRLWLGRYIAKGALRKSGDDSRLHTRKAAHNINFANWLMEKHGGEIAEYFGGETFYDWAISAYYYAIYHAALALVSKEGYSSKSHSATLCFLVYHHYHRQGAIGREDVELVASSLGREDIEAVGGSKELRERASYDVHGSFERMLAEQIRGSAVEFAGKIESLLKNA